MGKDKLAEKINKMKTFVQVWGEILCSLFTKCPSMQWHSTTIYLVLVDLRLHGEKISPERTLNRRETREQLQI